MRAPRKSNGSSSRVRFLGSEHGAAHGSWYRTVAERLRQHVRREIGSIAVPDAVYVTSKLPKTRSGEIMRRVILAVVSGQEIGDTTTLEDPAAVDEVRRWLAELEERRS